MSVVSSEQLISETVELPHHPFLTQIGLLSVMPGLDEQCSAAKAMFNCLRRAQYFFKEDFDSTMGTVGLGVRLSDLITTNCDLTQFLQDGNPYSMASNIFKAVFPTATIRFIVPIPMERHLQAGLQSGVAMWILNTKFGLNFPPSCYIYFDPLPYSW